MEWLNQNVLPVVIGSGLEVPGYKLSEVLKFYEVRDLGSDTYLVLKILEEDDCWLHWAVMGCYCETKDGKYISVIFHGEGPSDSLRECRHTYWGEDGKGYIFYPKANQIIAGLNALKEFYDMN